MKFQSFCMFLFARVVCQKTNVDTQILSKKVSKRQQEHFEETFLKYSKKFETLQT